MGQFFSKKPAPKQDRISDHDKAVLDLKLQRDKLQRFQKKTDEVLKREVEIAKTHLKNGNKNGALICLKKKKYQEQLLEKTDAQMRNLEELINSIEYAQIQVKVVEGLKEGNKALTELNKLMDIDEVEKLMQDTEDAIAYQNEISELLSGQLTVQDNEDIERELDQILEEQNNAVKQSFPKVPDHEPETQEQVKNEPEKEKRQMVAAE